MLVIEMDAGLFRDLVFADSEAVNKHILIERGSVTCELQRDSEGKNSTQGFTGDPIKPELTWPRRDALKIKYPSPGVAHRPTCSRVEGSRVEGSRAAAWAVAGVNMLMLPHMQTFLGVVGCVVVFKLGIIGELVGMVATPSNASVVVL